MKAQAKTNKKKNLLNLYLKLRNQKKKRIENKIGNGKKRENERNNKNEIIP